MAESLRRDLVGGLIVMLAAAVPAAASASGQAPPPAEHAVESLQAQPPAAAPAAPPIRRAEPVFKVMKEYEDLGAAGPYYPARAAGSGLQGGAALECVLLDTGALTKCRILVEKPPGASFGAASQKMAETGWMTAKPLIVDGQPLKQETVDILVPFVPRRR